MLIRNEDTGAAVQNAPGILYTPPGGGVPTSAGFGGFDANGGWTGGGVSDPIPASTPTASAPTPAPPAATPPGKITLQAGYTPDYPGLIQSDPQYIAAKNAADAAEATGSARRRAAIRDAFVRYGGALPAGSDQYGDVDQSTLDAASGNQNSVLAQLAQNYAQSGEQFKRSLAARGALQSGDYAYGQDALTRAYGQQQYDAANAFTGQVNQAEGDYAGILGGNATALGTAIGGAEQNVMANPAYRPVDAKFADYDAFSSSRYGKAVYKGADGNLYDSDGNLFTPPTANDQAPPTEQNPNPNPDANGVPVSAGFYGFDQNGNWIG